MYLKYFISALDLGFWSPRFDPQAGSKIGMFQKEVFFCGSFLHLIGPIDILDLFDCSLIAEFSGPF